MASPPRADDITPVTGHFTFENPRLFSSSYPVPEKATKSCNFITFLAVVQTLHIQFLPIMWQQERQLLGRGGTSQVSPASMNLAIDFAFKRVSDEDKLNKLGAEIYRCIINEIMVLCHPAIRNHSNIVELQGICWDIFSENQDNTEAGLSSSSDNDKIWPVLVFEKAQFGDLYQFAKLPIGRELDISERLKICLEIGSALAYMQSNYIIHGDIKPDNVLIFKANSGSFFAKVADFGFSTWFAHNDNHIRLPECPLWNAPEWVEYPDFTSAQAMKADVFSFGMLCLWFMFEKYLSGVLPLPEIAQSARTPYTYEGQHRSLRFLADLKKNGSMTQLAHQLVMTEVGLNAESRLMLQQFFSGCLAYDPQSRDVDIQHSLKHMNIHQYKSLLLAMKSAKHDSRTQPFAQAPVGEMSLPVDHDFKLCSSLYGFYSSDYRLRSCIVKGLEEIVAGHPVSPLTTQLALCYELEFGGLKSDEGLSSLLHNRTETQIQLEEARVSQLAVTEHAGTLYSVLAGKNHSTPMVLADNYREHNILETGEAITRKEAERIEHVLGLGHEIVVLLKSILSSIFKTRGRYSEAEKLEVEVIETRKKTLGYEHPITLRSVQHLVSTYWHQGRRQEADKLEEDIMTLSRKTLGCEHPSTLNSMLDLVSTYGRQGKSQEAEKLAAEVVEISKRTLGHEHRFTLTSMRNLAVEYMSQSRWQEAEKLQMDIVELRKKVLGHEHPDTLNSTADLAGMYGDQGKCEEAEKLELNIIEARRRTVGHEHPDTLMSMENLGVTYASQGRWQEAEKLEVHVLRIKGKTRGYDHPSTLHSARYLKVIYMNQGRWEEAEKLQEDIIGRKNEHPDTLVSMHKLALEWKEEGRHTDAQHLMASCVKLRIKVLGPDHPDTRNSIKEIEAWES